MSPERSPVTGYDARSPSACYEYIRDQYARVFRIGDRVVMGGGAELGFVVNKRGRLHYVAVLVDGDSEPSEYHPSDVKVVRGMSE